MRARARETATRWRCGGWWRCSATRWQATRVGLGRPRRVLCSASTGTSRGGSGAGYRRTTWISQMNSRTLRRFCGLTWRWATILGTVHWGSDSGAVLCDFELELWRLAGLDIRRLEGYIRRLYIRSYGASSTNSRARPATSSPSALDPSSLFCAGDVKLDTSTVRPPLCVEAAWIRRTSRSCRRGNDSNGAEAPARDRAKVARERLGARTRVAAERYLVSFRRSRIVAAIRHGPVCRRGRARAITNR